MGVYQYFPRNPILLHVKDSLFEGRLCQQQ